MTREITITAKYFREYRKKLGFANQVDVKNFFGAKDILPTIDFEYVKILNERLCLIIDRVNNIVTSEIKIDNLSLFKKEHINRTFNMLKNNYILPKLNNQGRRPEQVYFSWMRGYVISNFFLKSLGIIFNVNMSDIKLIGDDDLRNVEIFKRTPKADLEICLVRNEKIRIEMQSGFTGTNDIKEHKVREAKNVFEKFGVHTLAIHFDLYNGQVAFLKLDTIQDNDVNWITRQQMEGQTVFNIDQNHFVWKITEKPIKYSNMVFE